MIRRRLAAVAAVAVGLVALAGCLPSLEQAAPTQDVPWPGGDGSGSTASVGDVYTQTVRWAPCGSLECATIQVPLDWSNPGGATVSLSINRSQARNSSERIGSLLINPGGPGGSGLELTDYFLSFAGDDLLDRYDVIGFDPRGVGSSSPIRCGTDEELSDYFLTDLPADTAADVEAMRQRNEDFALRCRELTGPLIENVDTASAARDMDVIRAVLGDDKLHYLGFSYGTQLGATYAVLYPQNVGHMVLDGAVDFLLPAEELSEGQASGFESALDAYIDDCVSRSDCPFPRDHDLAKRAIRDIIDEARNDGIPTGDEDLNGNLIVYGIVVTLYDEGNWEYLSEAFDEVISRGTGRTFLALANFYLDRDDFGHYNTNSTEAFTAISCLDEPESDPWTIEDLRAYRKEAIDFSPTFGWWFAGSIGCDGWPWTAKEIIDDLTPAADAGPIVIIGTTGDPATPLEWAQSLADALPNATLLVYDGEGHTAYGRSNQCIIDEVDAYFVSDVVPSSGTTC